MAYGLKGAATLLLRSFDAPGGADEPRAAQAFERPRLSHPHHVLTLRSALVDRVAQTGICGPIFSSCLGPQRLWSMSPHDLSMTLHVGSAEDAQEKQEKRRLIELL